MIFLFSMPLRIISFIDLNMISGTIGTSAGIATGIYGIFYTIRKNRRSDIDSAASYESDFRKRLQGDVDALRAGSEKYLMLRRKVLEEPLIEGARLIEEVERQYQAMNHGSSSE